MLHLMNSAMMPQPGKYTCREVTADEFQEEFRAKNGEWKSYIGYPQTAKILSDILRIGVPVSRKETKLVSGDTIFAIKLRYRILSPQEKTAGTHGNDVKDYQFFVIGYE